MRSRVEELTAAVKSQLAQVDHFERQASEYRIKAGQGLLLRKFVEAGEAGEIGWWQYYAANFSRSRRTPSA